MKLQRVRYRLLALLLVLLLALSAVYGGQSVLTYGSRWFSSRYNPRLAAQRDRVITGEIRDAQGTLLAWTADGTRHYATETDLCAGVVHALGDPQGRIAGGLELTQAAALSGFDTPLFELLSNVLNHRARQGDTLTLTLDAALSRDILRFWQFDDATRGKRGAVVVMNAQTGAVLTLLSLPVPDLTAGDYPAGSLINRATRAVTAPGGLFRLVLAAEQVTGEPLATVAGRLGFNENFLFPDLIVENSRFPDPAGRSAQEAAADREGQGGVMITPLHLCMIAAALRNDGVMMVPRLVETNASADGSRSTAHKPAVCRQVLTAQQARQVREMLPAVDVPGLSVRGYSAGCENAGRRDARFAGWSEDEAFPIAVSVLVEDAEPAAAAAAGAGVFRLILADARNAAAQAAETVAPTAEPTAGPTVTNLPTSSPTTVPGAPTLPPGAPTLPVQPATAQPTLAPQLTAVPAATPQPGPTAAPTLLPAADG